MKIILDTTELYNDHWMRSPTLALLREIVQVSGDEVLIPSVVLAELDRQYEREVSRSIKELSSHHYRLKKLAPRSFTPRAQELPEAETLVAHYRKSVPTRLEALGIKTLDKEVLMPSLLNRALHGRRPFNQEGKKGFRDTLIWEQVLALACTDDAPITFITKNTKDFGGNNGLHGDLAQDLEKLKLPADKIRLVGSLHDFTREQAEAHLSRLVAVETELDTAQHPKISLSGIFETQISEIQSELEDDWGTQRLRDLLKWQSHDNEDVIVKEVTTFPTYGVEFAAIEVLKLEGKQLSISFMATFEVEVRTAPDSVSALEDRTRMASHDYEYVEVEMGLEAIVDSTTWQVSAFDVTSW